MRCRPWLAVWLLLSSGATVYGQQSMPATDNAARYMAAQRGGYQELAARPNQYSAPAPASQASRQVGYTSQDLSLEGGYSVREDYAPTAADASRAVAEQLRRQYQPAAPPAYAPPAYAPPAYAPQTTDRYAGGDSNYQRSAMDGGPRDSGPQFIERQTALPYQPTTSGATQPTRVAAVGMPGRNPGYPAGAGRRQDWETAPEAAPGLPLDGSVYAPPAVPSHQGAMPTREGYDVGGYPVEPQPMYGQSVAPSMTRLGPLPSGSFYNGIAGDCGTGDCGTGDYGMGGCTDGSCGTLAGGTMGGFGSGRFNPFKRGGTCDREMFTVVGVRWLNMRRDGADYKSLSYEGPMPTNTMLVEDANIGHQGGIEAFLVRQDACGRGWEGRYWGLQARDAQTMIGNMPTTQLTGLGVLTLPWGTVEGIYNMADEHTLRRTSELHSFEWNLVNHASNCGGGNWLYRTIFGLRAIRFRDRLDYSATSATNFGLGFDQINYGLLTRNTFVGAQAGGSGEYCVTNKLRLGLGATAGIGSVFIDADQEISTSTGVVAMHPSGGNFSYMNEANDLSVFGEFEGRILYHLTDSWRLSCGYRILGISGVALAQDQIPYAFSDLAEVTSVKRDSGLIVHGLTLGAEFSF